MLSKTYMHIIQIQSITLDGGTENMHNGGLQDYAPIYILHNSTV